MIRRGMLLAASTILASASLAVLPFPQSASAASEAIQAVADAYTNGAAPANNYGVGCCVAIGGSAPYVAFLRFEIPANTTSASLELTVEGTSNAGSTSTFQVFQAGDSWSEATLTKNNQPAISSTVLGSFTGAKVNATVTVPLTGMAALSGQQVTLALKGGSDDLWIWSHERGLTTAPTLLVTTDGIAGPTSGVMGDSVAEGCCSSLTAGGTRVAKPFWLVAAQELGWSQPFANAEGDTGYVANDKGLRLPYPSRIGPFLDAHPGLQVLVMSGGNNDPAGSALTAAVNKTFDIIKAKAPTLTVYVLGPYSPTGYGYDSQRAIIGPAAIAHGFYWIDQIQEGWMRGHPDYIWTDHFHPNDAGHEYIGERLATDITALNNGQPIPTPPPTPTVLTLNPTADAFGNAGAPTTNYGTNASLLSRGTPGAASYLRFNLPPAPASTKLTSAVLRLHTSTDSTAGSVDSHPVRIAGNTWTETGLTWNNRPPISGALLGTITGAKAVNTRYDTALDVTTLTSLLGTTQTFGVSDTGPDSLYVWSRNFSTTTSRPQLILSFQPVPSDTTPPSTPTVDTPVVTGPAVALSWAAASDDAGVTAYEVHRSALPDFTAAAATRVATVTGTTYNDHPGTGTWYYQVIAKDAAGNGSAPSSEVSATVAPDANPPTTPDPLTATVLGSTVTLSWPTSSDDFGVTGYQLYRSTDPSFVPDTTTLIGTVLGTSSSDSPGLGTWYYAVIATDAAGNLSAPSATVSATVVPDTTPPTTPGQPSVTVTGGTVSLSWAASTDDVGVTGYNVYRSPDAGFVPADANLLKTVSGNSTTDSPGLGTWYYDVITTDAAGNPSTASDQAVATVTDLVPPTVVTVSPTADTYVNSGAAGTNYGSTSSLLSRGSPSAAASYLRFSLPAAPAGKTLTGVLLRLHTTTDSSAGSGDTQSVQIAGNTWTESGMTWNNRPAISGALLGTLAGAPAVNASYDVALDPASLAGLLGTAQTFGITSAGTDNLYVWSRNYGGTSVRPQLVLTFT